MEISEKEFAVIREISNNHLPDQRTIATRTGISLGLTNLIIKRLIKKGYIKAKQLNQKKIQYLLTPKGFSEKAKKSYGFTLKTIGLFKSMKERIQALVLRQHRQGVKEFVMYGVNKELCDITEMVFKELANMYEEIKYTRREIANGGKEELTIACHSGKDNRVEHIDLVAYLSETGMFYQ